MSLTLFSCTKRSSLKVHWSKQCIWLIQRSFRGLLPLFQFGSFLVFCILPKIYHLLWEFFLPHKAVRLHSPWGWCGTVVGSARGISSALLQVFLLPPSEPRVWGEHLLQVMGRCPGILDAPSCWKDMQGSSASSDAPVYLPAASEISREVVKFQVQTSRHHSIKCTAQHTQTASQDPIIPHFTIAKSIAWF